MEVFDFKCFLLQLAINQINKIHVNCPIYPVIQTTLDTSRVEVSILEVIEKYLIIFDGSRFMLHLSQRLATIFELFHPTIIVESRESSDA